MGDEFPVFRKRVFGDHKFEILEVADVVCPDAINLIVPGGQGEDAVEDLRTS